MKNPVISVLTWQWLLEQNGSHFEMVAISLSFVPVAKHVRILPRILKIYIFLLWIGNVAVTVEGSYHSKSNATKYFFNAFRPSHYTMSVMGNTSKYQGFRIFVQDN